MKRTIVLILVMALMASLCACGGGKDESAGGGQPVETSVPETPADTGAGEDPAVQEGEEAAADDVEVDEGLFDVTVTIPAEFAEGTTQQQLDADVDSGECKSATLNEDGSVTMVLSKKQHEEMMSELADSFTEAFDEMINDEGTSFVSIDHNDAFTEFTVVTTGTELNLTESFSVMALYFAGGMYNAFAGNEVDNIRVQFVNQASGEVIEEANSRDMQG